jgi:hypothetical protein
MFPRPGIGPGPHHTKPFVLILYEAPRAGADQKELDYWEEDDRYTSAHEIGHSIVALASSGTYSARHKGTSTITGNKTAATAPYPPTGEIDLMKYWTNDPAWPPPPDPQRWELRRKATLRLRLIEEDMKTLLDFTQVEFSE